PPHGSVVLFSGWISRKPAAGMSTPAAIDGAIEALARTLALELAAGPGQRDHAWADRHAPLAIASLGHGGAGSFRSRCAWGRAPSAFICRLMCRCQTRFLRRV